MSALVTRAADLLRGGVIGVAEIIPGVSGGTVALLVGIYDTLIGSAATLVRSLRALFAPAQRTVSSAALREVPWIRLVMIAVGMLVGIVLGAAAIEPLIVQYPELTRAFFAGLIVASIAVPLRMIGWPLRGGEWVTVLVVASVVALVLGLPPLTQDDPSALVILGSAALAVCALVLPGVSGSFLLLTLGVYEPTLAAVNSRDLAYLGVFVIGAVLGLGSFVVLLQWLLVRRRRITLVIMTGLLIGSLRALWPWQSGQRELLLASPSEVLPALAWALLGAAIVAAMIIAEHRRLPGREG